jgi:hypothetical protein
VIVVRDSLSRKTPPPWMAGAADLNCRESDAGTLWGIGDGYLLGPQPVWRDLGDGYAVGGTVDATDPVSLRRSQLWADCAEVPDLHARMWSVPSIIGLDGCRRFRVAYGAGYLPSLTPEQYRALDIANAAREAAAADSLPMEIAAQYAAELLCMSTHLSVEVVQAMTMLDDVLILGVINTAIGVSCEVQHADS